MRPNEWTREFNEVMDWVKVPMPELVSLNDALATLQRIRPEYYRRWIQMRGEARPMQADGRLVLALAGDRRHGQTSPTPMSKVPRAFVAAHFKLYKIECKKITLGGYGSHVGGGLTALATPGASRIDVSLLRAPQGPALLAVRKTDKTAAVRLGTRYPSRLITQTLPTGQCGVEILCALSGAPTEELFGAAFAVPPRDGYRLQDIQKLLQENAPNDSMARAFQLEACKDSLELATREHGVASVAAQPREVGSLLLEVELETEGAVSLCDLAVDEEVLVTWKPGERHRGVVIETAVSLDGAAVRVQYADEVVWMRDDEGWRVERVPTDAASLSAAAVERANALARDRPVHWVGIDHARSLLIVGGGTRSGKLLSGVYEITADDRADPARLAAVLRDRHGIGAVLSVCELRVYVNRLEQTYCDRTLPVEPGRKERKRQRAVEASEAKRRALGGADGGVVV